MLAPHSPRIERELSSLGAFAELLEDGAVTPGVLSIDVFDTVITAPVASHRICSSGWAGSCAGPASSTAMP